MRHAPYESEYRAVQAMQDGERLDYFLDHRLQVLIDQQLAIDVIPRGVNAGCLIVPQRLRSIFQGMADAGEYRLDG